MADTSAQIPDRELFKASDVCEIASVQPYVLRSWELEFPTLGVSRSSGAPRVYRRADVARVLRIKHLVFVEGLTLAGARRRIDGDEAPEEESAGTAVVNAETRQKLAGIRQELRSLLDLLGEAPPAAGRGSRPARREQPSLLELSEGGTRSGGKGASTGARSPAAKRKTAGPSA